MYRLRQGGRALFAFAQPVDAALARQTLSPAQFVLFCRLSRSEQLHSLNVLRSVLAQAAHTPHDLAAAALLHDVGKSRYRLATWQKTLGVLIKKFAPALYKRWSQDDRLTFWRAPFVIKRHHAAWGADMLRAMDTPPRVVWLVQHHDKRLDKYADHPDAPLLARLKAADDAN